MKLIGEFQCSCEFILENKNNKKNNQKVYVSLLS